MMPPSPALPCSAQLLLIGGTGFVGRSLLKLLSEPSNGLKDIGITVLSRDPERFAAEHPDLAQGVKFIRGDVRGFAWPRSEFSHVIQPGAGPSAAAADRPRELISTIVDGTARVLDFAAECGAKKMLFLSSGAVYGRQSNEIERMSEDYAGAPDPSDPVSSYGNAKRLAEQLCTLAVRQGLAVKVGRLVAFVGEDLPLNAHFAIGNFIRDALAGGPIEVRGDGSPVRSYLYQGDLAEWLLEILERGREGRAYNVGSDEAIGIAELAQLVADVVSPGALVRIAKREHADYDGRLRYVPSIERARTELGLAPRTSLVEAIRRTAARHRR